jgi:hypothetical protein
MQNRASSSPKRGPRRAPGRRGGQGDIRWRRDTLPWRLPTLTVSDVLDELNTQSKQAAPFLQHCSTASTDSPQAGEAQSENGQIGAERRHGQVQTRVFDDHRARYRETTSVLKGSALDGRMEASAQRPGLGARLPLSTASGLRWAVCVRRIRLCTMANHPAPTRQ